ncbi:MAG TPA: hypothetical protein VFM18_09695, partial [Methanosarcina sp.]|nr:hypothetical protein [Methanosarcina sp.]
MQRVYSTPERFIRHKAVQGYSAPRIIALLLTPIFIEKLETINALKAKVLRHCLETLIYEIHNAEVSFKDIFYDTEITLTIRTDVRNDQREFSFGACLVFEKEDADEIRTLINAVTNHQVCDWDAKESVGAKIKEQYKSPCNWYAFNYFYTAV